MQSTEINKSHISKETSDEIIVGNPEIYFGTAIVAFIDILGYTESLLNNWGLEDNSPIQELLKLRDKTKNAVIETALDTPPPNSNKNKIYLHRTVTHSISDSFTISYAIPSDGSSWHVMSGYIAIIHTINIIQLDALAMGYVIRGGIEIDTVYWDKNLVMGPAYITAATIESKIAKSARIVVGPSLIHSLKNIISVDTTFLKKVITLDNDITKIYMLNCADGLVMTIPPHEPFVSEYEEITNDRISKKLDLLRQISGGKKIQKKYDDLIKFYSNLDQPDFASISDMNDSEKRIVKYLSNNKYILANPEDYIKNIHALASSRNAKCPCGSGKRYKNCHGKFS